MQCYRFVNLEVPVHETPMGIVFASGMINAAEK